MRVLVDTNIWLDVLLGRQPFVADSARALSALESEAHEVVLCATTITTLFYLTGRALDEQAAWELIGDLLASYSVARVDAAVLRAAHGHREGDFEDWVVAESARLAKADAILTRDLEGFKKSPIPARAPRELLAVLAVE